MADEPGERNTTGVPQRTRGPAFTLTRHISRVAAIFDAAPVAVGVWSVDGELLHANPVLCDLVGQTRGELLGITFEAFIRPSDAPTIRRAIEEIWHGERNALACDFRCRLPDGGDLWLRQHLSPVYGPGGRPEYFMSHIFDFAPEVRPAERDALLADETPVILWLTDRHGIPREGNRESYEFLGRRPGTGVGGFLDHLHPDDYEALRGDIVRDIRDGRPFEFTARSRRHDGDWRWLHHRARPVRDGEGQFSGWAGASFDVTEAERLRRELDEVRRLFESVTEAGPVAVVRTDVEGKVTYANGRWAEIIDDPVSSLLDLRWQSILVPEHVQELVVRAARSIATGEPFRMRVRALEPLKATVAPGDRTAQYWGELRVAPVFDGEGRHDGFVATLTDITNEVAAGTRADRLARVVDAGSDFLLITDRSGAISYVNDATLATLGVEAPEDRDDGAADADRSPTFLLDVLDADSYEFFHEVVEPVLVEEGLWRGELTFRTREGGFIPVSALVLAQEGPKGPLDTLSIVARDISDLKAAHNQLTDLATHDYVTGLPNRVLLYDKLDAALHRYQRTDQAVALLYLDLDRFKPVNDELGHHVGDAVLMSIADRIHNVVRDTDTAARIGGDEFAVLVEGVGDLDVLRDVATRLIAAIGEPFEVEGVTVTLGVSIGVVVANEACHEADALVALADSAMYQAKAAGRGCYELIIPNGRPRP